MDLTDTQLTAVREAFENEDARLVHGVGESTTERCTIAAINIALTGKLTDKAHPCVSEVIRQWVIRVQDAMPVEMLNEPQWRQAAIGIAGSAAPPEVEQRRVELTVEWMWDRLADPAVLAAVPVSARGMWDRMLAERTADAARAAYAAAYAAADAATYAACAAAYAADAADAATYAAAAATAAYAAYAYAGGADAYWRRADPALLLAQLVKLQGERPRRPPIPVRRATGIPTRPARAW